MNRLRDLLDAEHALASEEATWREAAEVSGKEDRFTREALASERSTRMAAVRHWLEILRGAEGRKELESAPALPGDAMVRSYGLIGGVALGAGLLIGIVTTQGALW
ncbi:MAG: hypothetical protein ACPG31_08785, partial [Planctomycetota bacterium]